VSRVEIDLFGVTELAGPEYDWKPYRFRSRRYRAGTLTRRLANDIPEHLENIYVNDKVLPIRCRSFDAVLGEEVLHVTASLDHLEHFIEAGFR
jgi:hypothetical protein